MAPIGGGAHAGEGRFERPLLATGKVRYVGEPIALVLAGTKAQAADAAAGIWAEIEPLETVTDPWRAAEGAPSFDEGNVAFRARAGSDLSAR